MFILWTLLWAPLWTFFFILAFLAERRAVV